MSSKKLSPGDILDARCSRCKTLTNHTLIALVDDTPAQVQCNTCGGKHKYRPPATSKTTRTAERKRVSTPRISPAEKARTVWQAALEGNDPSTAVAYRMDIALVPGQLINHPTFGLGLVQSTGNRKAILLFEEGEKILRCGE